MAKDKAGDNTDREPDGSEQPRTPEEGWVDPNDVADDTPAGEEPEQGEGRERFGDDGYIESDAAPAGEGDLGDKARAARDQAADALEDIDLDSDDLALIALGAGVAAVVLSLWGRNTWLDFLSLPLGAVALFCGYKAQREDARYEQQAVSGMILGTIAVTLWIISSAMHQFLMLLGR